MNVSAIKDLHYMWCFENLLKITSIWKKFQISQYMLLSVNP